ncbi:MAG: hypothetical protein B7Z63_00385, partial [Ignavibacteriae bacterium 37-53-5]
MKSVLSKFVAVGAIAALAILVVSCGDFKKSSVVNAPSNGSVDFSVYVALGNSLTAGYQSGALYESAQEYSFPADIARQAGISPPSANFMQPLISDPGIGGRMKILNLNGPVIGSDPAAAGTPLYPTLARPYNNLGIPGAVLYDMIDTTNFNAKSTARQNPFFSLILRNAAFGNSPVAQALALHPTFVSVWIGANDVLGYATSGGTNPITDPNIFGFLYGQLADSLASLNTKVVVATIPAVTAIPYFTTVPAALKDPASGAIITLYGQTTTGVRALVPGQDLLTLTASTVLLSATGAPTGVGLSPSNPIPNKYVLDKDEVAKVANTVAAYNQVISGAAAAKGFALVDIYTIF